MQYKFHLNNLRIAPRKVRRAMEIVKKLPVGEAEAQLKFQGKRASLPILKLLKSGVASAVNNFNLSPDNLYVFNIFVDEGPMLKRFRARAFGKAGAIHKKTSHITLVLEEKAEAGIKKTKKRISKIIDKKSISTLAHTKSSKEAPKEIRPKKSSESITRKIFRRKAIG